MAKYTLSILIIMDGLMFEVVYSELVKHIFICTVDIV